MRPDVRPNPLTVRYLVLGGAGFIGTNFVLQLAKEGKEVIIFDNFSKRGASCNAKYVQHLFPNLTIIRGDIARDTQKLRDLMDSVDVAYHLAGQTAVTRSITNPDQDFKDNLRGTFNVLEAIRRSKRKPIMIFASSNKVYGSLANIRVRETASRYAFVGTRCGVDERQPLDFHSPYGCSKGSADQYVRDYARIFGLQTVVLRQSCVYGPHQHGTEEQGWLAWFAFAHRHDLPVTVYGNGKQTRDVLYIDDLFEAWRKTEQYINEARGEVFNIGGGPAYTLSLLELIRILERASGNRMHIAYGPLRPGDQKLYVSDISKATRLLGWRPHINILEGLRRMHILRARGANADPKLTGRQEVGRGTDPRGCKAARVLVS